VKHYILKGREPVPATLSEWAIWMERCGELRQVAETLVGEIRVSTIFLGLDHNFLGNGPPVLFETMAFVPAALVIWGREFDRDGLWQTRAHTWDEALATHAEGVQWAHDYLAQANAHMPTYSNMQRSGE
jgi:hypothetical protein